MSHLSMVRPLRAWISSGVSLTYWGVKVVVRGWSRWVFLGGMIDACWWWKWRSYPTSWKWKNQKGGVEDEVYEYGSEIFTRILKSSEIEICHVCNEEVGDEKSRGRNERWDLWVWLWSLYQGILEWLQIEVCRLCNEECQKRWIEVDDKSSSREVGLQKMKRGASKLLWEKRNEEWEKEREKALNNQKKDGEWMRWGRVEVARLITW